MTVKNHMSRCAWVTNDQLYIAYHDHEWGVPIYDDRLLFEFLILEGAQAGLSWLTVLKKRDNYRACFDQFNPLKMVCYDTRKIAALLDNPGIIRNKLKVNWVVENAKSFLNVKEEWDSFSDYIWQFVDGNPIQNHWQSSKQVPDRTPISDRLSKDLKKKGV